jgi:hypothetical protein
VAAQQHPDDLLAGKDHRRRDRQVGQAGVPEQPRQLAADPGLNGIVCRASAG